ncbi:MAG TPA: LacI family DNA-binding transcriptional regulator, partial [Alphaproteobacteria bacterium]|nr:LacI family DNA-binding transcriptional regulator [Alphaproteobacteria bacterium]
MSVPEAKERREAEPPAPPAPATMKDVARLAGVSTATVSRALMKPEIVSAGTRELVLKAVAAAGYTPNVLARNLRRMETRSIIVVVQNITNPFYPEIFRGVEQEALARGFSVLMGNTDNDPVRERAYAEILRSKRADGMILLSGKLPWPEDGTDAVDRQRMPPTVLACEPMPGLGLPTVRVDNAGAAREAVAHLASLGHRRVGHLIGPPDRIISADRLRGWREAVAALGLDRDEDLAVQGDYTLASGIAAMERLLDLDRPPTAVFAANDEMAIGAIRAVHRRGLKVPEDVSVVGFDDILFASAIEPPLTTIA